MYAAASPLPPAADEVPVPAGGVSYWSAVLGLYLYAAGKSLRLHDPRTGLVKNVEEKAAAREAAEAERRAAETRADRQAARADALEAELKRCVSDSSGGPQRPLHSSSQISLRFILPSQPMRRSKLRTLPGAAA